jgi:hypothetical protein
MQVSLSQIGCDRECSWREMVMWHTHRWDRSTMRLCNRWRFMWCTCADGVRVGWEYESWIVTMYSLTSSLDSRAE